MGEREDIRSALPEKPLKVFEIMRRANMLNEDSCQSLLLKMRDEPPRVCRRLGNTLQIGSTPCAPR
jgi:hypothetical protein